MSNCFDCVRKISEDIEQSKANAKVLRFLEDHYTEEGLRRVPDSILPKKIIEEICAGTGLSRERVKASLLYFLEHGFVNNCQLR